MGPDLNALTAPSLSLWDVSSSQLAGFSLSGEVNKQADVALSHQPRFLFLDFEKKEEVAPK